MQIYRDRGWDAYLRGRFTRLAPGEGDAPSMLIRLGEVEEAVRALQRLLELRHPAITWTNFPEFDRLRSDSRFLVLRRRAGLTDEMNASLKASRRPLTE